MWSSLYFGVKTLKLVFPPIGARIMKSAIAVGLCMLVYFARTLLPIGNGIPFYGALAALWCIQPYNDTTKNNAVQRSVGTLIGAVYGLAFLLLFRLIGVTEPMIVYISASAVIIPVIYTTVVLNKRNASFFSSDRFPEFMSKGQRSFFSLLYSFVSAFIIGVDSDDAYKNSVSISDMFLQAYEIWISGLLLSSLPPVKEIQNYLLPLLCRNVF